MFGQLLQADILVEVGEHIVLRLLYRAQVKFLQTGRHRLEVGSITH